MNWPFGASAATAALFTLTTAAWAVPIPAGLNISGSIDFDNAIIGDASGGTQDPGQSSLTNTGFSGSMQVTVGGGASNGTITGLVAAPDPISGVFADIGDGLSISGATSPGTTPDNPEFHVESLIAWSMANTTADTYKVTIKFTVDANVSANGADAFSEAQFDFGPGTATASIVNFFALADTLAGNNVVLSLLEAANQAPAPGGAGGTVAFADMFNIDFILTPGTNMDLFGNVSWNGIVFSGTDIGASLAVSLSVFDIMNLSAPNGGGNGTPLPEPASFGLLLLGLGAMMSAHRHRL